MTTTPQQAADTTANWVRYWRQSADDEAGQQQLGAAARDPYGHWLVADIGVLTDDEIGIDLGMIRRQPDGLLAAAREAFEIFVTTDEIDGTSADGFDALPIHLVGLPPQVRDDSFRLTDPTSETNILSSIPSASIEGTATVVPQAAVVTYRCPAGHETTVSQPVYTTQPLSTCGEPQCTNEVHADATETRIRKTVQFDVLLDGQLLACVGTGIYADTRAELILNGDRVRMLGVVRPCVSPTLTVEPRFELLSVGPA
jgi:hypothetical protein